MGIRDWRPAGRSPTPGTAVPGDAEQIRVRRELEPLPADAGRRSHPAGETLLASHARRRHVGGEDLLGRRLGQRAVLPGGPAIGRQGPFVRLRSRSRWHAPIGCGERYCPNDEQWTVEKGSVLDRGLLQRLGQFDVVYCWGVLHHTGQMWTALHNMVPLVAPGGRLFIAIYNDQGRASRAWLKVKKLYNTGPAVLRPLLLGLCAVRLWGPTMVRDLARLKPFRTWREYRTRARHEPLARRGRLGGRISV